MNRHEEYKSAEELREEIAELKIQLAFQEQFEKEMEDVLKECEEPDPELMQVIDKEEDGLLKEISKQVRKRRFSASAFLRSEAGRVAAMVVVMMLVSISSAMAAIQMVRAGVFALDIVGDNRRMSVRMVQTKATEVPDEWTGNYYPTYIPKGFEYAYIDEVGVCYLDQDGSWMVFEERNYGTRTSIDIENANISSSCIDGADAVVIEKSGVVIVVWMADDCYFVVRFVGAKEIAIQIAASVISVK